MTRVMAQGTFDVLHPGHLHYLRESSEYGDELYVVIARDSRMKQHKDLYLNEQHRKELVDALKMVDRAVLGSEGDIFDTVKQINPDIITIGHDQQFGTDKLEKDLTKVGLDSIEVERISRYDGPGVVSSSEIKEKLKQQKGEEIFEFLRENSE